MRLLALLQGRTPEDQIGYHSAFERLAAEGRLAGYLAMPWRGPAEDHGWNVICGEALRCAREFGPDAVYFQFFHAPASAALNHLLASLVGLPSRPLIVVSGGDAFAWHRWMKGCYPEGFLAVAKAADVTFVTAMGKCADFLARQGVRNIALLPLGVCQVRFKAAELGKPDPNPEFDVVFIGRNCRAHDPRGFHFYYGIKRRRLVQVLDRRYGRRFGLFGPDWDGHSSWCGTIPYADQLQACRRSRVVFGGAPGIYQDYYASDRPFIQGLSGVPLVDWRVPRTGNLMRDGEHWHLVGDERSMIACIDRLLALDSSDVAAMTGAAASHINAHLTQEAMMRFLVANLHALRAARLAERPAPAPRFPFFLPEVNLHTELPYAVRNWVG